MFVVQHVQFMVCIRINSAWVAWQYRYWRLHLVFWCNVKCRGLQNGISYIVTEYSITNNFTIENKFLYTGWQIYLMYIYSCIKRVLNSRLLMHGLEHSFSWIQFSWWYLVVGVWSPNYDMLLIWYAIFVVFDCFASWCLTIYFIFV